MDKRATLAASSAVCAGLIGTGRLIDRRFGTPPAGIVTGTALAAAYLGGTYLPNLPLFGPVALPPRLNGDTRFSLTFDDGPDPRHTPAISTMLAERGHRATFFTLGRAVEMHPEVIRQIAADGHEVACHGHDHRLLAFTDPSTIVAQITSWEEAVLAATGCPGSKLFRAPHGFRSPWLVHVARRKGYAVCGWNGRVFDTSAPDAETIVRRVVPLLQHGSVVLLHDGDGALTGHSRAPTVRALSSVLDTAERRGLQSATLGALLGR